MSRWSWSRLTRELARRGRGERESGAFLLARVEDGGEYPRVREWICFDDLDPAALNGAISIRGSAFNELWGICAERGLRVVGDVHTHPSSHVAQSHIDASNPMVAKRGHVALILPRFGAGRPRPANVGLHLYEGSRKWRSYFDADARRRLRLRWW
jgi:proteasome lid subunit RPN8/RPN11